MALYRRHTGRPLGDTAAASAPSGCRARLLAKKSENLSTSHRGIPPSAWFKPGRKTGRSARKADAPSARRMQSRSTCATLKQRLKASTVDLYRRGLKHLLSWCEAEGVNALPELDLEKLQPASKARGDLNVPSALLTMKLKTWVCRGTSSSYSSAGRWEEKGLGETFVTPSVFWGVQSERFDC